MPKHVRGNLSAHAGSPDEGMQSKSKALRSKRTITVIQEQWRIQACSPCPRLYVPREIRSNPLVGDHCDALTGTLPEDLYLTTFRLDVAQPQRT